MASADSVYVYGLETFYGMDKVQKTDDLAAAIAANSSVPADRIAKFCMATQVQTGYAATAFTPEGLRENMDMPLTIRYERAAKVAIEVAKDTVERVLKSSNIKAERITHIVTCTCTALFNPGLETIIPDMLGFRKDIFAIGVNFMGCHAGVKTLATAASIAKANPGSRVLFLCCEICTLFFPRNLDSTMEILSSSLFREGCAAGICGTQPEAGETPLVSYEGRCSYRIPDTLEQMTWLMKDERADLYIGKDIPDIMREHLPAMRNLIPDINDCRVALHPGGPAILKSACAALSIPEEDVKHAFGVLNERGNMSSSCIFYVTLSMLKEMMAQKAAATQAGETPKVPDLIMMAFGPGLTTECARLRLVA